MKIHHQLTVIGELCPVPLLRTQELMRRLKPGETLAVLTEHPQAARNVYDWALQNRCLLAVYEDNGIWRLILRKPTDTRLTSGGRGQ